MPKIESDTKASNKVKVKFNFFLETNERNKPLDNTNLLSFTVQRFTFKVLKQSSEKGEKNQVSFCVTQSKKMLSKRSRTMNHHHMKMKASIQYVPSDDDISQMLKEFTVDFLLNGIVDNCYLSNIWNC